MSGKHKEEPKLEEFSNEDLDQVQGGGNFKAASSSNVRKTANTSTAAWPNKWKMTSFEGKGND